MQSLSAVHVVLIASIIARFISAIGGVLIIKLIISAAGVEAYAGYALVAALGPWVALLDIGGGFSLQNHLAETKLNRQCKADLMFTYLIVALIVGIVFMLICFFLRNVAASWLIGEVSSPGQIDAFAHAFATGMTLLTVQAWGAIGGKVLFGLGKAPLVNILNAIGVLLGVFIVFLMKAGATMDGTAPALWIVVFAGLAGMTLVNLWYFLFAWRYAKQQGGCWNFKLAKANSDRSNHFFRFSLIATFIINFEALIYARILSPVDLASYLILQRIFAGSYSFFGSATASLWPTLTRCYNDRNDVMIRLLLTRLINVGLVLVGFVAVLVIAGREHIFSWMDKSGSALVPSVTLIVLCACYYFVRVWTDAFAMLLQSSSNMGVLNNAVIVQGVAAALLQVFLGAKFGALGLVGGSLLAFLSTVSWVLPKEVNKHLKSFASNV
jgi:O-antigen/teichoic acid export membrane protein